jgi:hypothetical protein
VRNCQGGMVEAEKGYICITVVDSRLQLLKEQRRDEKDYSWRGYRIRKERRIKPVEDGAGYIAKKVWVPQLEVGPRANMRYEV